MHLEMHTYYVYSRCIHIMYTSRDLKKHILRMHLDMRISCMHLEMSSLEMYKILSLDIKYIHVPSRNYLSRGA